MKFRTALCGVIATMFAIDVQGRRFLLLLGGGIMTVSMALAAGMGDDNAKKTCGFLVVGAI